ncbi:DUF4365 domain-containing protein [Streptomyces sp. NPDC047023]|uniref:DUF4365 domain-containing protein n=1 Tax=Streptomyces sp. NPDC047023 TaxID=3155139 RepID=UPI00340C674F
MELKQRRPAARTSPPGSPPGLTRATARACLSGHRTQLRQGGRGHGTHSYPRHRGATVPNRPVQHRIASLAVSAVRQVWNRGGHAVDEIQEDYGEDLLVQLCLNGRMDPARIWVQVKGTERETSKKLPTVSVSSDQVLRWARTADLVVVVLWDVNAEQGWFILPQEQFDQADLMSGVGGHKLNLKFSREFEFDINAAERLAWAARIEHANRTVVYARAGLTEAVEMDLEANKHFHKGIIVSTVLDFAVSTMIFTPGEHGGHLSEEFVLLVWEHFRKEDPTVIGEATGRAMMLAVFQMIADHSAGNGAPLGIVKETCEVFYPLLFSSELLAILAEGVEKYYPKGQKANGGFIYPATRSANSGLT